MLKKFNWLYGCCGVILATENNKRKVKMENGMGKVEWTVDNEKQTVGSRMYDQETKSRKQKAGSD